MKKYLAYDGINCEYENFNTIEEARKWLVEAFLDSSYGYHPDLKSCAIYKLEETVDYDVIDSDNQPYTSAIAETNRLHAGQPHDSA